jgi:hydroxypyruvate isomerase
MLRFDVNLSLLFTELPFLDRFAAAAAAGFGAVEFWWPAEVDLQKMTARINDAGLRTVMFNIDAGDMAAGERGLLNDPALLQRFRAHVPIALELAHTLGCRLLHVLVGNLLPGEGRAAQLARIRDNFAWAAEQAAPYGITLLLEPLNALENPLYPFTSSADALSFLDSIGAPNVKLQYDTYHMYRMGEDPATVIPACLDRIGHIQVADVPGRHQPGTGKMPYPAIFAAIARSSYTGYIGLEYNPAGPSAESFNWLPPDRRGVLTVADLRLPTDV